MPAIFALIAEVMSLVEPMVSAGIDIANVVSKAREVLDANKAPDDADWKALDAQVEALRARLSVDPA